MEYVLNFGNDKAEATRVVNYLNLESGLYNINAELIGHFPMLEAPYKLRFHLDAKRIPVQNYLKDVVKIKKHIVDDLAS